MLMPSIFDEKNSFFDDDSWMNFPGLRDLDREFFGKRNPLYGKKAANMMKTDVKEVEDGYELAVDLPGFKKEDVNAVLEDGYLTISAQKGLDKEQKDKDGRFIRQERYSGSCSRSFYVGASYKPEDISAKFEDGILKLHLPKANETKVETEKRISIEG